MREQISNASAQSYFPSVSLFVLLPFICRVLSAEIPALALPLFTSFLSLPLPTSASAGKQPATHLAMPSLFTDVSSPAQN